MDWKEFFKLTKLKILTIIILFPIGYYLLMYNFGCAFSGPSIDCEIMSFLGRILLSGLLIGEEIFNHEIVSVIIQIIYMYTFTCIIVFIGSNWRTKKGRKDIFTLMQVIILTVFILTILDLTHTKYMQHRNYVENMKNEGYLYGLSEEECRDENLLWAEDVQLCHNSSIEDLEPLNVELPKPPTNIKKPLPIAQNIS